MDDEELVTNLDRVAKNINTALKRLRESTEPMNASAAQLPLAKQYLADLKRMTEEGAHVVMDVTEALQEAQGRMSEALANTSGEWSTQALHDIFMENETRFIQIYTALSFQDLVAQRIAFAASSTMWNRSLSQSLHCLASRHRKQSQVWIKARQA